MTLSRRNFLQLQLAPSTQSAAAPPLTITPIVHLLNRITWGPRPEEVAHAEAIGYEAVLEEQLNPESLDDQAADAELARLPILFMDRATVHALPSPEYRTFKALVEGMVVRAVYSRRQLLERVVEFWADHFNIPTEGYSQELVSFQRDVIRRHALGNFRDLLIATAQHPAMLYYLDNANNLAESPNENYARELLELYTLGVDGGYSEDDVKAAARAFTGWTVHNKTPTGFYFNAGNHDTGSKTLLGHTLPAERGLEDGLQVLSIAANHPATAHFLSYKLARRFVSDQPPASLVDQLATVWQASRGDIKTVLRTLFLSAEFKNATGQKFRRPLDFFIGALRATGTRTRHWWLFEELLNNLGQMPYGWAPPNGYPDVAGAWMGTGGLLARWNVAMRLTHGAVSDASDWGWGFTTDLRQRIGDPQSVGALVDAVATQLFGAPLTGDPRQFFVTYVTEDGNAQAPMSLRLLGQKLGSLYGLMLASPYYQWR
jgi:uncharacterized protein (DUF1800 family)